MESSSAAIATIDGEIISTTSLDPKQYFNPAVTAHEAIERQQQLTELVSKLLIPSTRDQWGNVNMDGADYGVIPGTKNRTLFQPGAEKLALFFGLTVTVVCQNKIENWQEGFFFYEFKATASYKGQIIRETVRSCHTRETKYAWIWVTRAKPSEPEIAEALELKTGRFGKIWENKQQVSVWQERRPNPDPFSLQFVVQAMAQKRAKVAVVKEALAATGYFSTEVDFEDFRDSSGEYTPERKSEPRKPREEAPTAKTPTGKQILALKKTLRISDEDFVRLIVEECGVDAQNPTDAVDAITDAEQKLMAENLKKRLQESTAK